MAIAVNDPQQESDTTVPAPEETGATGNSAPAKTRGGGWHPAVALLLVLVVLLPTVATAVLTSFSATASWNSRQNAQRVASDATQLRVVALARAQLNEARTPAMAIAFANSIHVPIPLESKLLHLDLYTMLSASVSTFSSNPVFNSTPVLRQDNRTFQAMIPRIHNNEIPYAQVRDLSTKFDKDIDSLWYADFNKLQQDVQKWKPPGSFEAHVAALRLTYNAFLAGGYEVEGAIYVLEDLDGAQAKEEILQAAGNFATDTTDFVGYLGPRAQAAWKHIQTGSADVSFTHTIQQGVEAALGIGPAIFTTNVYQTGQAMEAGLTYLGDLNALVRAGATDLQSSALAQASHATHLFIGEVVFLVALVIVSIGGAVIAGRSLTRPLKRLASTAQKIHLGVFDLDPLPDSGPREVVTTNQAFNDMASTLKGVEAKTMALATEDVAHPELQMPLPGRTGQALQVAVDKLAAAIREREAQRQQLHHTATHDSLTSLYNRAAIFEFLTHDVERRRQAGETVGVLFVDLNGLKQLNDTYGHEAGDAAICATSEALLEASQPCDVVGRLGGDEFLIVLCHEHGLKAEESAAKMSEAVGRRSVPAEGKLIPLTASVGLALAQCDANTDPMELVRQADDAMYDAKKAARATRDQLLAKSGPA